MRANYLRPKILKALICYNAKGKLNATGRENKNPTPFLKWPVD